MSAISNTMIKAIRAPCLRGRPAIVHDNKRGQAFARKFACVSDLGQEFPAVDDALVGITYLQTEGQESTRPLSKRMLFRVIQECEAISSKAVAEALGRSYSLAAVGRYTAIARVASRAIDRFLDQNPGAEDHAGHLKADRQDLDHPYVAEMLALGLM
jgi:hypothetical protein